MLSQSFFDFIGHSAAKRFRKGILPFVDLFAGAGGTSSGLLLAMRELRLPVQLAAVNHWDCAISTHELNHSGHLHFCTGVDKVDIEDLLCESDSDGIFGLWGSPSCVNFSAARGGVPLNAQDRSGCWALVKWLRSKRAIHLWGENVVQFLDYGPVMQKRDQRGHLVFLKKNAEGQWRECPSPVGEKPKGLHTRKWLKDIEAKYGMKPAMIQDPKKKGLYFKKWIKAIRKLGYDVEWRVLNAADYGAPTKRLRLIIEAVKRSSGRKIVWPNPTHGEPDSTGSVPSGLRPWRTAREIIDWSNLGESIFTRSRPLADKTIDRIAVGLIKYGLAGAVVKLKGTGTANSVDAPLGTVQASGLHYGVMVAENSVSVIIPQQRGHKTQLRVKSVDAPLGTITGTGAEALATSVVVGVGGPTGSARPQPVSAPLGTVIGENHRGVASAILRQESGFLVPNFGERPTQIPRTHSLEAPVPVITSHGAGGLVTTEFDPFLVVTNHGNGPEGDKANLRRAKSLNAPVDTVTGSNSLAIINGTMDERVTDETPTVVSTWQELAAVIKSAARRCRREPSHRPLISYNGVVVRLEIRFRMLGWRELANAQSFPSNYQFTGTDGEKVKQIGNAVPPALAYALGMATISQNPDIRPIDEIDTDLMKMTV